MPAHRPSAHLVLAGQNGRPGLERSTRRYRALLAVVASFRDGSWGRLRIIGCPQTAAEMGLSPEDCEAQYLGKAVHLISSGDLFSQTSHWCLTAPDIRNTQIMAHLGDWAPLSEVTQ